MKYLRNMKFAGIFIALLLVLSGCSSNTVPTTSPVEVDAQKQSQTQKQPNETTAKETSPTPAATTPTATPVLVVAPTPAPVVAPTPTPVAPPVVSPGRVEWHFAVTNPLRTVLAQLTHTAPHTIIHII